MSASLLRTSKRQAAKDRILEMIRVDGLRPGDQILSQNQLAELLGVHVMTVIKALAELCEENVLYREQGRGTFISQRRPKARTRKFCLVLPGRDCDLRDPHKNPTQWPGWQQWFKTFMERLGPGQVFSSMVIASDDTSRATLDRLKEFDATFFLAPAGYERLIMALRSGNVSCPVIVDEPVVGVEGLYLPYDRHASVRLGLSHLLGMGYRRIALLRPSALWFGAAADAYMTVMGEAGLCGGEAEIFSCDGDGESGLEPLFDGRQFDAVFCATASLGLLAVERLRRNGLAVPGDVGVMADQGYESIVTQPPYLTAMSYPSVEIFDFALSFLEANHYRCEGTYRKALHGRVVSGRTCGIRQGGRGVRRAVA